MKRLAQTIKSKYPNYLNSANDAFCKDYSIKWGKPMYQDNSVFKELKDRYDKQQLNRQNIIDLFHKGYYYDGFLCAMVWGNMGTYIGGKNRFDGVFDIAKKAEISAKINRVIVLLQNGKLEEAYLSLCYNGENRIVGVGEAFFTKLLYFAGVGINNRNLNVMPLIFDSKMHMEYSKILTILKCNPPKGKVNQYIDYCNKMEELRKILDLQSSGYVEALLFSNGL